MVSAERLLEAFSSNHADYERVLLSLVVNDSDAARTSALLLTTTVEAHGAVCVLADSGYLSHAPVLCRSMIEAFASLARLVTDPGYLDQLHFDDAAQGMKVVEEFRADPELSTDEVALAQMDEITAMYQETRTTLWEKGLRPEHIEVRMDKAGLKHLYAGYRAMCVFAHNNLVALNSRHVGQSQLRYLWPISDQTSQMILGLATSICGQAINLAPKFTSMHEDALQPILQTIDNRWERALAWSQRPFDR